MQHLGSEIALDQLCPKSAECNNSQEPVNVGLNLTQRACPACLHGDRSVLDLHFLCQEVGTDCGFVLTRELLVDVLVHKRGLANPARVSLSRPCALKRDGG